MTLRDAIGTLLIIAFVAALGILFWKAIPEVNKELITYMLGQLSGFAGGIVAYHYASNALSVRASENTGKMADAIKESAVATQAAAAAGTPNPDPNALRPGDTVTLEQPPVERG